MPSNESVIPTVSVSAITKLNGKIGIVSYQLPVTSCRLSAVSYQLSVIIWFPLVVDPKMYSLDPI